MVRKGSQKIAIYWIYRSHLSNGNDDVDYVFRITGISMFSGNMRPITGDAELLEMLAWTQGIDPEEDVEALMDLQ